MFQHVSAPGRLRLFCLPLAPLLLFCLPALLHGNVLEDSRRALLVAALAERKIPFEIRPLFAEFGGFGS